MENGKNDRKNKFDSMMIIHYLRIVSFEVLYKFQVDLFVPVITILMDLKYWQYFKVEYILKQIITLNFFAKDGRTSTLHNISL